MCKKFQPVKLKGLVLLGSNSHRDSWMQVALNNTIDLVMP